MQQHPAGARVVLPADIDEVGAGDVFRVRAAAPPEQADEGLAAVGFLQRLAHGLRGHPGTEYRGGGGGDAGIHRDQVRDETDDHFLAGGEAEFLLDLRRGGGAFGTP